MVLNTYANYGVSFFIYVFSMCLTVTAPIKTTHFWVRNVGTYLFKIPCNTLVAIIGSCVVREPQPSQQHAFEKLFQGIDIQILDLYLCYTLCFITIGKLLNNGTENMVTYKLSWSVAHNFEEKMFQIKRSFSNKL